MPSVLSVPLVLDASVLINLLATGRLASILSCFCPSAVVVEEVIGEVRRNPRDRQENAALLDPFFAQAALTRDSLSGSDEMLELYLELAGADEQEDLGDGEAASMAYAVHKGYAVALDERKARAVCRRRFPNIQICSTLDMLRALEGACSISREHVVESVYDALKFARMRVPPEHDAWVRGLLSAEQLKDCPSLRRMY